MDRIDLQVQIDPVPRRELFSRLTAGEASSVVATRVAAARAVALQRWQALGRRTNAEVPGSVLRERPWALPRSVLAPVEHFLERGVVSARGFDRILRIAWTVADLAGRTVPDSEDVGEALFYRTGQAGTWAA
jgi:magnesium chelatase family protein